MDAEPTDSGGLLYHTIVWMGLEILGFWYLQGVLGTISPYILRDDCTEYSGRIETDHHNPHSHLLCESPFVGGGVA